MGSYLVGASGVQVYLQQADGAPLFQQGVFGNAGTAVLHRVVVKFYLIFIAVFFQKRFFYRMCGGGGAKYQTTVELGDFTVLYLLVQDTQAGGIFGRQHKSCRVAVNAVAQGGHKAVFGFRVIFAAVVKAAQNAVDQGVHHFLVVLVYDKALGFVYQQNVFIFVNDVQFG